MKTDLTTVAEVADADVDNDDNAEAQRDEENEDDNQAASRGSGFSEGGRASLISGTTAKTSFSAHQISEMDADLIVDSLKGLDTASEELLKLLIPADAEQQGRQMTWKDIVTRGTRTSKLYMKRVETLRLYKSDYIAPPSDYIQPSHVLRALTNGAEGSVSSSVPRPDSVLRKANLATMLHSLLIAARDPLDMGHESFDALEAAEENFALAVAPNGMFQEPQFDMALALAIQLAIKRIASFIEDPNFNPRGIATNVFFDYDEDDVPTYRHLSALGLDKLSDEEQAEYVEQVNYVVEQLKEPFEDGSNLDNVTALNTLRAKFPWDSLVNHLMVYYENRKQTLDQQIAQVGGIDLLVERLRAYVQADEEEKRLAHLRSSIGGAVQEKPGNFGVAALKALASDGIAQAAMAQAPAPAATMVPSDAGAHDIPTAEDDASAAPFVPQGTSADLRDLSEFEDAQRRSAVGKGKVRSFNDPQPGASRVSWDDSQQSQQPASTGFQLPRSSVLDPELARNENGKRPRGEDPYPEIEPSQDDGLSFQTDKRDIAAANARRQTAPRARPQPRSIAPRPISPDPNLVSYETPASQQSQYPSPSKRPRKNPGASIPAALPPTQGPSNMTEDWHQAKVRAKMNRAFVEPAYRQQPRQRQPWSSLEEGRLFELIADSDPDDVRYAVLKSQDVNSENILHRRTKEDMRFKARNMKVVMLEWVLASHFPAPLRHEVVLTALTGPDKRFEAAGILSSSIGSSSTNSSRAAFHTIKPRSARARNPRVR